MFEFWIDIAQQVDVDMYAAAQRVLGEEAGTGWAEVHDDDQPPVKQRAVTSLLVGTDLLAAVKLYEELIAYNQDRIIGEHGGYIRLRFIADEKDKTGTVIAQRAKGAQW